MNRDQRIKIAEIRVEEDDNPHSGINDSLLPMWCYKGNSFIVQCLCKWTMSLVDSTWGICQ